MGIAVWSPPLDKAFNSAKGSHFLIELIKELGYDDIDHVYSAGIWGRKQVDEEGEDHSNDSFHLLYLAKQNKLADMRRAVAQGMNVNYSDYDSRTPLHLAANYGNFDIVKYLVKHGAKINVHDRFGNSPIDEAKENGYEQIEKYLIKKQIQQ